MNNKFIRSRKIIFAFLILLSVFVFNGNNFAQTSKPTYRVAIDREYEPYEFINFNDQADGFTPSLLKEIKEQLQELQEWHDVTINREERIIELKNEINSILKSSGNKEKYKIE